MAAEKGNVAADELRQLIERAERLEEEKKALGRPRRGESPRIRRESDPQADADQEEEEGGVPGRGGDPRNLHGRAGDAVMDVADTRLIVDIGTAAAREALRSIIIKVDTLPADLRVAAMVVATSIVARKAASVRRQLPGAEDLAAVIDQMLQGDGADLAARVASVGQR